LSVALEIIESTPGTSKAYLVDVLSEIGEISYYSGTFLAQLALTCSPHFGPEAM
jgi:hypothetical protein